MRRPRARAPVAVVLDLNKTGCAIARCLGRAGVAVTGVHAAPYPALGALSRYVMDPVVLTDAPEADVLDALDDLAERSGDAPILLCATDQAVDVCSRHRSRLERRLRLPQARTAPLHDLLDKGRQAELARRAGLAVPAMTIIRRGMGDVAHHLANVALPAIIRPGNSLLGYKRLMRVATTRGDLLGRVDELLTQCPHLVVSSFVPGPCRGNHTVMALGRRDGSVVIAAVTHKLRQVPQLSFGAGSLVETCRDEELEHLTEKFIRAAGLVGPVELEFKREHGDGAAWFLEANLRSSALVDMTAAAGMNLPYLAWCDAAGMDLPSRRQPERRVVWVDELRDWRLAATGEIALAALLESHADTTLLSLFARDDPAPFAAALRDARREAGADEPLLMRTLDHLLARHAGTADAASPSPEVAA